MRWCLYIPSILILLTLGVELCSAAHVGVKNPDRLVCVLDDDDAELKEGGLREHSFPDCGFLHIAGQQVVVRWVQTGLILSRKGAEILEIRPGVRRHRWLCRECC